jgi:hypothetical protein
LNLDLTMAAFIKRSELSSTTHPFIHSLAVDPIDPKYPPAEGHGEDRRVTRKTRSAIHSGALPIFLPLTGSQQASSKGPAANAVRFTPN